ncbi:MAG: hypothetical protein JWQ03_116 [Variovorax sp.]|nr:hypothetical protein [Variovorax sp.]
MKPSNENDEPINKATGVDKAMKQFSKTDAERERPDEKAAEPEPTGSKLDNGTPAAATQPPPSTAPAGGT